MNSIINEIKIENKEDLMKLLKILNLTNQTEKNSFIKILTNIISEVGNEEKRFDDIKNMSNEGINEIFKDDKVRSEFKSHISNALAYNYDLDILIDILIRDGNCIMSRDWLNKLYNNEMQNLKNEMKEFCEELDNETKSRISDSRNRDYTIYRECVKIAYTNDELQNRECVITHDEFSILNVLSDCLDLSQDEKRYIYYSVIPLEKGMMDIELIIKTLKDLGLIFYSRKNYQIYIPEETIIILRHLKGYEVASKHFRRILKTLKDNQLTLICNKHNINRKLSREDKIKAIIKNGLNLRSTLSESIFKENVTLTEKKNFINELIDDKLKIILPSKGKTLKEKVDNLIRYYSNLEKEEKLDISNEGYEKLLKDISLIIPDVNEKVKEEFEIQGDNILNFNLLLDYNIKPRDVLDLMLRDELLSFCKTKNIKSRGNLINNILESYRDSESLYIENYQLISNRDYNALKDNGIDVRESELGVTFEKTTKIIFKKLGFDIDEKLKSEINDKNNKLDIVLRINNKEIIIIECKTHKDSSYNKFSSIYRQIKAYINNAEKAGYKVIKSLIIANDFSDDFVNECELDFKLNLSLITAQTLISILNTFKESNHDKFPYKLFMKDVLINDSRINKAIMK